MIGISWGGFNGLQIAARRPPALGAVISLCSTDDRYADDIHFMGGAVLCDKLNWGATAFAISNTLPDPAIVGSRWREMWHERIENNGLWMLDWFRHQRRDAFYAHGSVCENYTDIDVPVYMVGGWADGYTNAIFRTLEHLPGPKKGLIGPWAHKYPHFAQPGPRVGFLQECLRWWDLHLKGIETGIMDEPQLRAWVQEPAPPAEQYESRPGRWVAEHTWRGTGLKEHIVYPGAIGLTDRPGDAPIMLGSPQTAGAAAGVWCGYGIVPDGPLDQNGEADHMTLFETAPVEADFDLLGFPIFSAELESATPQANLVAVLSLVDTSGRATLVSYGVLNLTHRDSHAAPRPMPSGEALTVRLQLNACGQRIPKGYRIRLALSTAYWPVIWPSQERASLRLSPGTARLALPLRPPKAEDSTLAPFPAPEAAPGLETETLREGHYRRARRMDPATGEHIYDISSDSGAQTHLHTGITVDIQNTETFRIQPDDPNSATGHHHWTTIYARGDWRAELTTEVSVKALRDVWSIQATLSARDTDGIVAERSWSEDIPRDLV